MPPLEDRPPPTTPLDGTSWQVTRASGATSTISFAEGRAFGSGGVNRYTGTAELDGERLGLGPFAVTRMAGPPEAMADEDAFLASLATVTTWALEDGRLLLRDADGATLLVLEPAPGTATGGTSV